MDTPGRNCPLSYRYGAQALSGPARLQADTVWIAGGLYGNTFALQALLDAFDAEPGSKALVFNGDFHWFDVDAGEFQRVNETVLGFHALRGNVESELAAPAAEAGCGCAYPEWVGDATVAQSNRIIERLRATARAHPRLERLAALPMHLVARVGQASIGIVHGDADSLAGWAFSQEALCARDGWRAAQRAFDEAGVDVFASTHTCLPVLQDLGNGVVVNNGAAGMPNFHGETYGLATRISVFPGERPVYGTRCGKLFIEAMPLRYDAAAWQRRFLAQWPPGSDAHRSYWERMVNGPAYAPAQAVRLPGTTKALSVARR
jgi:hypothetical protein